MPHLTFGIEYKILDKISFEIDYGRRVLDQGIYPFLQYHLQGRNENHLYFDSLATPSFGERIHFEFKYYLPSKHEGYKNYIGFGYYNIKDVRNRRIVYYVPDPVDTNSHHGAVKNTAIAKELQVFDVLFGHIFKMKKFSFDNYVMLGLKHKNQDYIENEYHRLDYSSADNFVWDQPMNSLRLSFNFGFRLAYSIYSN